jgi:hypothetical protein
MFGARGRPQSAALPANHPVATVFLDETGSIANDRFFAIGCLKMPEPSRLVRKIQSFRDRTHWYSEMKFSRLSNRGLRLYEQIVDIVAEQPDASFYCFVADRATADPIERFGTHWDAYGKLAEQLVIATMRPGELIVVLADNYSTPNDILFEETLRASVNRRLQRLAVVSACRLDSKTSDALQVVDLFTSGIAFEFRQSAGLTSEGSPKVQLAEYIRSALGAPSCLTGWRNASHSVALYHHGSWSPSPRHR